MIKHYLNGILTLDEQDQSRMNYVITNLSDGIQQSITDILDTIYNSSNTINKLVRVFGRIYNSNHTFTGFNSLYITKDNTGVLGYHIGNFQLERQLYELVGEKIELLLEDYTESTKDLFVDIDTTPTIQYTTEDITYDTTTKTA